MGLAPQRHAWSLAIAGVLACDAASEDRPSEPESIQPAPPKPELEAASHRAAIQAEAAACLATKHSVLLQLDELIPPSGEAVFRPLAAPAWWDALRGVRDFATEPAQPWWRYADGYAIRVANLRAGIRDSSLAPPCRLALESCVVEMDDRCADFETRTLTNCAPDRACRT